MSTPATEPIPLILDNAGLKINDVELACLTNHVELSPDVAITTLETFCGSRDYPGNVKWSLVATLYQSFDPDATEEVLSAAVEGGVPVTYEIVGRRSQPVSETNPSWSGMVIPQPYAPINGDAGDVSTVDLDWSTTGTPLKSTAPAAMAATVEPAVESTTEPDLDSMTVAQLQALAAERGLPTSGTKAELIAALSAAPA
jgi:hypothetical protein